MSQLTANDIQRRIDQAAEKLENDPTFQANKAKAKAEIEATGKISGDTFAALMGAAPVSNPTPRERAICASSGGIPEARVSSQYMSAGPASASRPRGHASTPASASSA